MKPYLLRYILPSIALGLLVAAAAMPHSSVAGTEPEPQPQTNSASSASAIELQKGDVGNYLAGRYARSKGDAEAASYYFSHSLGGDPKDENLMKQAVRSFVLAGKMDDAMRLAEKLSASHHGTQLSHLVLIANAIHNNDLAAAKNEQADVENFGLFSVIQPVLAGWVSYAETGKATAIALNKQVKKLAVFDPFVAFQNALLFDAAGETKQAQGYYEEATKDIAGMSYRNLLAVMNFYLRSGQAEKAKALFARFSEENRTTQVAEGESYEDAVRDASRADGKPYVSNAQEGIAEELFAVAGMLYGENVEEETQLYLRLALYLNPTMGEGMLMLGSLLEEKGSPQKAIAYYDAIEASGPIYRRAQLRKAFVLAESDHADDAVELLETLAHKYPHSADIFVTLGDVFRKEEKFGKAVEAYSKALEIKGSSLEEYHWPILYARGISHERDGDWARAEQDFQAALKLAPNQPDVLNYLGYSWLVKGIRLEEAKKMLEQAVAERPEDASIVDSMGWALYMLGDYTGALDYLEQAIDLTPGDPVVNDHYGDALWRVGRRTEARFQWDRALLFKPEESDRKKIEEKLKSGLADGAAVQNAPAHVAAAGE